MKTYERIKELCELAQTYAEDGAYVSAARLLKQAYMLAKVQGELNTALLRDLK